MSWNAFGSGSRSTCPFCGARCDRSQHVVDEVTVSTVPERVGNEEDCVVDGDNDDLEKWLFRWHPLVGCMHCGRVFEERLTDHVAHLWSSRGSVRTTEYLPDTSGVVKHERLDASLVDGKNQEQERCVDALMSIPETPIVSHHAVTPDFQEAPFDRLGLVTGADDPYISTGLTSAVSLVCPRIDATAGMVLGTMSGALAEMERLFCGLWSATPADGDLLDSGGEAVSIHAVPDVPVSVSESQVAVDATDSDAKRRMKHSWASCSPVNSKTREDSERGIDDGAVTAEDVSSQGFTIRVFAIVYFTICDVVMRLGLASTRTEKLLIETAFGIYRIVIRKISVRNRIPEALSVGCILIACERLVEQGSLPASLATLRDGDDSVAKDEAPPESLISFRASEPKFVERVVEAARPTWPDASLPIVYDYLRRLVNTLLEKRPDTVADISEEMPRYCAMLGVSHTVEELAQALAERATIHRVCVRRNSASVCAAAIYLATHLDDAMQSPSTEHEMAHDRPLEQEALAVSVDLSRDTVRLKQKEIVDVLGLSEVTLRKAHKEMLTHLDLVMPPGYRPLHTIIELLPPTYQKVASDAADRWNRQQNMSDEPASCTDQRIERPRSKGALSSPTATQRSSECFSSVSATTKATAGIQPTECVIASRSLFRQLGICPNSRANHTAAVRAMLRRRGELPPNIIDELIHAAQRRMLPIPLPILALIIEQSGVLPWETNRLPLPPLPPSVPRVPGFVSRAAFYK